MRILAATPWVPDATRTRARGLLKLLAEDHDVDLVHAAWEPRDRLPTHELGLRDAVAVPMGRPAGAVRAIAAVPSRRPLQIAFLDSRRLRSVVGDRWRSGQYDFLYLTVFRTLHLGLEVPAQRIIADLDEIRSEYWETVAHASTNPLRRLVGRIEAPRMRRWERAAGDRFAAVLFSNGADADSTPRGHLVRSPHGLAVRPYATPRDPDSIVFVGRLGYAANAEALVWFVRSVLPLIRSRRPRAHLDVVGRGASAALRRELLSHGAAVRYHGEVDRIEPFYDAAAVSIAPIRMATGVQLKVLESFARSTPVVCSERVAALAGVIPGHHCLVADAPDEWAASVIRLLDDQALGGRLAGVASDWLQEFSDAAVREQLDHALAAVGGGARASIGR